MGGNMGCCEGDPPNQYQHAFLQQEAKSKIALNSIDKYGSIDKTKCNVNTRCLCKIANRIIDILYIYRQFMSNYPDNKQNLIDLVTSYFHKYDKIKIYHLSNLKRDFNHIINKHINNKIFMTNLIELLSTKNNYQKCVINKCHSCQRNNTNYYYDIKSIQDIQFINELDHVHKYFEHSFSFLFVTNNNNATKLRNGRNKENDNNIYTNMIKHEFNSVIQDLDTNEFKDESNSSESDENYDYDHYHENMELEPQQSKTSSINDGNSSQYDLDIASNTPHHENDPTKGFQYNHEHHDQEHPVDGNHEYNDRFFSDTIYDKSKRFYYWPSYKTDDRRDLRNGGKYSDWYIEKKYDDLKQEIEQLSKDISDDYAMKNIYQNVSKSISKLDKTKWKINDKSFGKELIMKYGMNGDENISDDHLIALKIYCEYPEIRQLLNDSFIRNDDQTIDELKENHARFYHLAKYLREGIECFGDEIGDNDIIYHGINEKLSFSDPNCKFIAPTMCIKIDGNNKNNFDTNKLIKNKNGMVMRLQKKSSETVTYFDCNKLFEIENKIEQEALFIGGLGGFRIIDINILGSPLTKYINGITIISDLINGKYKPSIRIKSKKKKTTYEAMNNLLSWKLSKSSKKEKKYDLPPYIMDLFDAFCKEMNDKIIVNLDAIQTSYVSIKDHFVFELDKQQIIMVKLINLVKMFKNVSIIEIKYLYLNDIVFNEILSCLNKLKFIKCKLKKIIFSDLEINGKKKEINFSDITNWEFKYMNNASSTTTLIIERQFEVIINETKTIKENKSDNADSNNDDDKNDNNDIKYCDRCKVLINGFVYKEHQDLSYSNLEENEQDDQVCELDLDFFAKHPLTKIPDDVWIKKKAKDRNQQHGSLESLRKKKVVSEMKHNTPKKQPKLKTRTTEQKK